MFMEICMSALGRVIANYSTAGPQNLPVLADYYPPLAHNRSMNKNHTCGLILITVHWKG
jgi:hypothetical protein